MTTPDGEPTLIARIPGGTAPVDVLDSTEAGRRVMVGGVMRIGGYGLGLIASVIAAAVVFRYFGEEDYGRFSTVLALVTGLQIVTDLGITSLGVREYAQRTGEDRERFMRVLLGMRLVTTSLLLVSTTAAALIFGYDSTMIGGAALLGLAASIGAVSGTVGIPLAAEIRMGVITGIDVARQVATGLAYVVLAAAGAGMLAFFGVAVPIYIVVLLTTFYFVRGTVPLRPIIDPRAWGELIAPTITFALASAAGSIYVYGAMVLTELVTDKVETSLFGAAFRVYIIISAFPVLLVTTAFPVLARAARDDRQRLTYAAQRLVEGTAILGGATVIALVVGAEPIILTLAGDKFADAIPSMRIQGVALAITFVIATFGFTLIALHRHRAIIICNAIALTVSATTVLTLGSAHGADGASLGVLLGEITLMTVSLIALRTGPDPVKFKVDRVARIVPPLALGLACWFLPTSPAVATAAGLVIYLAGLVVLRALPVELEAALPGPLKKFVAPGR